MFPFARVNVGSRKERPALSTEDGAALTSFIPASSRLKARTASGRSANVSNPEL